MIRSMTGYGTAERVSPDGGVVRVEVKTVNHRHLNPHVRLPNGWEEIERPLTALVREAFSRGHVTLSVGYERPEADDAARVVLDLDRARAYATQLETAKAALEVGGQLDINTIARLPEVFVVERREDQELPTEAALACAREALAAAVHLRETEGSRLEIDLRGCLDRIASELQTVETLAPERLIRERDRLREQIQRLAESVEVDEDRLAREVAYLAEKWDINEEIVRFRSHLDLFTETLDQPDGGKAGKRLGFIVQEMNREANTIGSKANDPAMAAAAIAIKEELERIREQLENVE